METATIKELKKALEDCSHNELINICARLSRFKKENKELLTYLLFESSNQEGYIKGIKEEIEADFKEINTSSYYYIKKSVRKILRNVKKYIRYTGNKETEVALLLHFCKNLYHLHPPIHRNMVLKNMYEREMKSIKKKINELHDDLQYDYLEEFNAI